MNVRMTDAEAALFRSFLECSRTYVEFGAGGSTCLAAATQKDAIISVDSSDEWLEKVRSECASRPNAASMHLVKVDIGPTGDWGVPLDAFTRDRWPDYYTTLWANPVSRSADTVLVDGRFRVACFMATLMNCHPGTTVIIHDYASRPHYHVVREVAHEIARAGDLSVFRFSEKTQMPRVREIMEAHAFEPA